MVGGGITLLPRPAHTARGPPVSPCDCVALSPIVLWLLEYRVLSRQSVDMSIANILLIDFISAHETHVRDTPPTASPATHTRHPRAPRDRERRDTGHRAAAGRGTARVCVCVPSEFIIVVFVAAVARRAHSRHSISSVLNKLTARQKGAHHMST